MTSMKQTPVHENHNPDLLKSIPIEAKRIIEIGCSSGALAREFKKISPNCHYSGVEIDAEYAELAKRYCDDVFNLNIDHVDEKFWHTNKEKDCWIFGDTLEHLVDPWEVLKNIRSVIPENGFVLACIPNVQHWSVQVRLNVGHFKYQPAGLLDKTHLRWFTRITIIEMFAESGFGIQMGFPRIFNEPEREKYLEQIGKLAEISGANPVDAINDALPLQYVIRAVPI